MNLTLSEIEELSIHGKVAWVAMGTRPALAGLRSETGVYGPFSSAYSFIDRWLLGQPIRSEELYFQHIPPLEKYLYHFEKGDARHYRFYACLKAVYYAISRVDGLERFQAKQKFSTLPNEVAEFTDGAILQAFAFTSEGQADKPAYLERLRALHQVLSGRLPASAGLDVVFPDEETLLAWQRVFPESPSALA